MYIRLKKPYIWRPKNVGLGPKNAGLRAWIAGLERAKYDYEHRDADIYRARVAGLDRKAEA
jgi:hypothetical protein